MAPKKYGDRLQTEHSGAVEMGVTIRRFTPEPDGD